MGTSHDDHLNRRDTPHLGVGFAAVITMTMPLFGILAALRMRHTVLNLRHTQQLGVW